MTQALPLIDALTTLGWRLTSVGPPRLAAKDDQSLWSNFKWNPSSWWRGKEVGFNFDQLCTEGMGGELSWVKSWENVWRIHLEEEWGSRECFLMYPAPGNGCRQGINTDNTGGVRRLEEGREGGKGWRGVREGEGRVLNGVWRGGYLLRKGGCYSKCQLTEIEMTDFLTSSEFVVPKKSADEKVGGVEDGKWKH